MRKIVFIFFMLAICTTGKAQQNIDSLEFGIDNILGFGLATNKIPVTPAPQVTAFPFTVNIASTSDGIHVLFVRTHSSTTSGPAQGYWSETNYTYFYKQSNITPLVSNIQKLEYFIDTDPGEGNAITINVTPAIQVSGISFNPNIGALANGFHVLFIRSLDQNGNWSITNYQYFYKQNNVPPVVSTVSRMEYFIDTDPGAGNGTSISFAPATNVSGLSFNANINTLTAGFHVIFIRSLDANGKWGITNYAYFYKSGPQTAAPVNIVKIEYFIDTDPGYFSAVNVPVAPAQDIPNKNFSANITGLPIGLHYLNVRSLDSRGIWSLNAVDTFRINSVLPIGLVNFSAIGQQNIVNLTWLTSFEQDIKRFEVEYSKDGLSFTSIGTVNPSNNPSGSSYNFKHLSPVQGSNFYRLKIIETGGNYFYSAVRLVNFKGDKPQLILYPDPTDNYFTIKTDLGQITIDIIDAGGKIIKTVKAALPNPLVDVSRLPSGLYTVRVASSNNVSSTVLIITH